MPSLLFPAVPWIILPNAEWSFSLGFMEFRPWRLIIFCYLLPGFIGAFCLMKFIPESPRFFLARGRDQEALDIIHWIYETNTGKPKETCDIKRLTPEVTPECLESLSNKKTWFVFLNFIERIYLLMYGFYLQLRSYQVDVESNRPSIQAALPFVLLNVLYC